MTNLDVVHQFVETLLASPELTMRAVQLRLSASDYELVLKKADPLKHFEVEHADPYQFPFMTGERSVATV